MTNKPNMKWAFIETLDQTAVCPVCGKEYQKPIRPGWGYKSKDVCSYHCQRQLEREDPSSYEYRKAHEDQPTAAGPKPLSDLEASVVRRMYAQGESYEKIAHAIKRPVGSMRMIIRKLGLKPRSSIRLSPDTIRRIGEMRREGKNGYQIAKALRVSTYTVYRYWGMNSDVHIDENPERGNGDRRVL